MKTVSGNLIELALEGKFNAIIHGCNCFNTMKSGIAKEIAEKLPEAVEADKATEAGCINKLGTYSRAFIKREDVEFIVYNAYTQYRFKRSSDFRGPTDIFNYTAFDLILYKLRETLPENSSIGFPLIGCGLAGGSREKIVDRIKVFSSLRQDLDVNLVVFRGEV